MENFKGFYVNYREKVAFIFCFYTSITILQTTRADDQKFPLRGQLNYLVMKLAAKRARGERKFDVRMAESFAEM